MKARNIRPKLSRLQRAVLDKPDFLFGLTHLHDGAVNVLLPQQMQANIQSLASEFSRHIEQFEICYAMKANNMFSILREVERAGFSVDVSSKDELVRALAVGFTAERISCSGPKDRYFLFLAAKHGCTICVDSTSELQLLSEITQELKTVTPIRVLLRVNNPEIAGRYMSHKKSKFGIELTQLDTALQLVEANASLVLKGFQYHANPANADVKAGIYEHLLELMLQKATQSKSIDTLNIGGGFVESTLEEYSDWTNYVSELQAELIDTGATQKYWGKENIGLFRNDRGSVSGVERALALAGNTEIARYMDTLFQHETSRGLALGELLNESLVRLAMEPGQLLAWNCALTVTRINSVKELDGNLLVFVNANSMNFAVQKNETILADPVLLSRYKSTSDSPPVFIAGNLCLVDDFIMKRRVHFDRRPEVGDLLVFPNTGAYNLYFEDASPALQPQNKSYAVRVSEDLAEITLYDDENYSTTHL